MSYYLEMANQALATYEAAKHQGTQAKQDALAAIKASNARMTTHRGQRIVAVAEAQDTPALRDALETLGYGTCRVLHVDTAPLRGKGSEAVAAAITAIEDTEP